MWTKYKNLKYKRKCVQHHLLRNKNNHNMIIIIRHKKKKWKNAINAVHLLVQRRLRKVWRNPDPEGSSAYFHWTEKETFPEKGFFFFWSLLFFLMHFIWHYLILNRVSLSLTRSMDIKNCWNDSTLQQYSNIHLHIIFIQLNKHLNSMQLVYQSNLSCSILSSFSFCCCSCLLPVVVLLKEASISFGASVQCVIGSQMS